MRASGPVPAALLGSESCLTASYATALEKAPLLTFCHLAVCDLGLYVPRPGPQFPPFQNAQYSCVVI